jgi:hypothetical protein
MKSDEEIQTIRNDTDWAVLTRFFRRASFLRRQAALPSKIPGQQRIEGFPMRIWLLAVLTIFALFIATLSSAAEISASEAKNHIGERATVCGKVASERTATNVRGAPTFINLDAPFPNQIFTILIWGEDRPNVGELPAEGSRACATGEIRNYRGKPEIEVKTKEQLSK